VLVRVQQGGDQADGAGAGGAVRGGDGDLVADHAHGDRGQVRGLFGDAAAVLPLGEPVAGAAVADQGQVGAVRQRVDDGQQASGLHTPEEVGAGVRGVPDRLVTVVAAIGQQQHARLQGGQQVVGLREFLVPQRSEDPVDQGTGAAFDQGRQPHLGISGRARGAHAVPGEVSEVRGAVGDLQTGPVPGHQPQPSPRPRVAVRR
jgi:hypothetical protein